MFAFLRFHVKLQGMSLLLPTYMQDLQFVLRTLDWKTLSSEIDAEMRARLVIVGPVNSGKSTLFNRLHGQNLSAVSAVPGTTQGIVEQALGPFMLVDTPGFGEVWGVDRAAVASDALSQADLILLLLDAAAGVRQSDHDLFLGLQKVGKPVVVAINKVDLIKKDLPWVLENAESLLGLRPLPVSAKTGQGITDLLIPTLLKAQPNLAVAMARSLPAIRANLVQRVIRRTAWTNALMAMEPIPGLDVPVLLASQTRMVMRIAAAYGQPLTVARARELISAIAGGLAIRYLGGQLAKFIPGPGWVASGAFAAAGTWAIGEAARRYFEAGAQITAPDLRKLYEQLRRKAPRRLLERQPDEIVIAETEAGEAFDIDMSDVPPCPPEG